ncbi:TOR signaling pathway regulator TapA [Blastomyces gilchristii SLH14081]|uniref:TOR signaling pathway regulator TapA n=1 Tax=Blastomyces gilchristii (strain SLH14081) TaxID=559298 RepID=A0A179UMN2_BLAGS|nr:TOR signaling pathway regulator TapA [Blastomyces gilchristii SLH14081]OAT08469.1 TOR signaling pathway regulator TapA [Blastomyces gilchristii SLH14081]
MDSQPETLHALFSRAKSHRKALDSPESEDPPPLGDVIAEFEECQRRIAQLSLFSTNESLDDVTTGDLQYLTVDYILADLLQKSYDTDRLKSLQRSQDEYEKYLESLDQYGLLSPEDKKLYERYTENPRFFSIAPLNDAAARRNIKVSRFRDEKELKQRLEYLSQSQNSLQADEDLARQLYLAEIKLYTHQTFQALDMLSQELSMLASAQAAAPPTNPVHNNDPRLRSPSDSSGFSDRLDVGLAQNIRGGRTGPLLSKTGVPLQPFVLTSKRTEIRKGVFRPGHNLPTMSIDEYLEEEKKRGGIIEGGGEQSGQPKEIDEDDIEKADEETMKARAWDEFTEDNPRGSGNTLNRG